MRVLVAAAGSALLLPACGGSDSVKCAAFCVPAEECYRMNDCAHSDPLHCENACQQAYLVCCG